MTDLLTVVPQLDTAPFSHLLPSLERSTISTADLLSSDVVETAKRAQLPAREIRRLADAVLQSLQSQFEPKSDVGGHQAAYLPIRGSEALEKWRSIHCLEDYDAPEGTSLQIPTGYVTEITGESGSGKTQWLLSLLLAVQLPPPRGLHRAALYISTEAPLQTARLDQILGSHPLLQSLPEQDKPTLARVLSIQAQDLQSQEHIVRYQLPVAVRRYDVGLVVIDSITANFRAEFDKHDSEGGRSAMARRSVQLLELGANLRQLARDENVAVVVANQVADRFQAQVVAQEQGPEEPVASGDSTSSAYHRLDEMDLAEEPIDDSSQGAIELDHQQRWFTGWGDEKPGVDVPNQKTPSLGLIWTNQIDARIVLTKLARRTASHTREGNTAGQQWKRLRKVVFAAWSANMANGGGAPFIIDRAGLPLSKSANKKKHKREATAEAQAAVSTPLSKDAPSSEGQDGMDSIESSYESPYVKELQKQIRNNSKKLNAMQKVDSIIAENPGVSLESLVAQRKINTDQQAQALKKPALQTSLQQLEEQLEQYKKFEADSQQRMDAEKKRLQDAHQKQIEELQSNTKSDASGAAAKDVRQKLLTLSRFLRAAAARRQVDEDNTEESKAFEGVLLLLYGGDTGAVEAAERLINGTQDTIPSTEGIDLDVSYERIKQLSLEYAPFAAEEAWVDGVAQAEHQTDSAVGQAAQSQPTPSDPTITHATLTEIDTQAAASAEVPSLDTLTSPGQIVVDDGAANTAGEGWDSKGQNNTDAMAESWVSVSRDPQETDSPSVPAQVGSTQNWADEAPPNKPPATTPSAPPNDGFHEVHRNDRGRGRQGSDYRGGGRGRGGYRGDGRGRGGGYRGDRGDGYRGRGRGSRGDRGRDGP
ncbi:MAG: hypothetical protein M1828_005662 [Chrysothrix sp. TS-e1954]|nr:MAG: hypothetical protein M1828_005662 [Chrysothrix sp. TS-e1954]